MISACVMQINEWLLERRAASPEELPAFPSTADGGSRAILQQATAAAAAAAEPPAAVKGSARPLWQANTGFHSFSQEEQGHR